MKPLVWMRAVRDSDLPSTVRATAWAVGLRADQDGQCWPKYELIAQDIAASKSTAIRNVAVLRDQGWLLVAKRSNGHGQASNSYLLTTPPRGSTHDTPGLWITPDSGESRGSTHDTPGVAPMTPRRGSTHDTQKGMPNRSEADTPVDNPHLAAVLRDLDRHHRIPR